MALIEMRHTKNVLSEPNIKVYVSDWKGDPRLHVRSFVDTEKYSGPTKKGIAVPLDNVLELAQGILDVFAKETGLQFNIFLPEENQ